MRRADLRIKTDDFQRRVEMLINEEEKQQLELL
jgi:hypothetical protein